MTTARKTSWRAEAGMPWALRTLSAWRVCEHAETFGMKLRRYLLQCLHSDMRLAARVCRCWYCQINNWYRGNHWSVVTALCVQSTCHCQSVCCQLSSCHSQSRQSPEHKCSSLSLSLSLSLECFRSYWTTCIYTYFFTQNQITIKSAHWLIDLIDLY